MNNYKFIKIVISVSVLAILFIFYSVGALTPFAYHLNSIDSVLQACSTQTSESEQVSCVTSLGYCSDPLTGQLQTDCAKQLLECYQFEQGKKPSEVCVKNAAVAFQDSAICNIIATPKHIQEIFFYSRFNDSYSVCLAEIATVKNDSSYCSSFSPTSNLLELEQPLAIFDARENLKLIFGFIPLPSPHGRGGGPSTTPSVRSLIRSYSDFVYNDCIQKFAVNTGNASLCENLSGRYFDRCYSILAIKNRDSNLCGEIGREDCEIKVQYAPLFDCGSFSSEKEKAQCVLSFPVIDFCTNQSGEEKTICAASIANCFPEPLENLDFTTENPLCLNSAAARFNEIKICQLYDFIYGKNSPGSKSIRQTDCVIGIRKQTGGLSICDYLEDGYDNYRCKSGYYYDKALSENDPDACRAIRDLSGGRNNNYERDCYRDLAIQTNDFDLCKQLNNFAAKRCEITIASEIGDTTLCELVINDGAKDCYILTAVKKRDSSICESGGLSPLDYKNCLEYVAVIDNAIRKNDPSVCNEFKARNQDNLFSACKKHMLNK